MSEIMGGASCAGRILSGACLGGRRVGLVHAGQLICPSGKNLLAYPLGRLASGLATVELMPDGGLHAVFKAGLPAWAGLMTVVRLADINAAAGDRLTLSCLDDDTFPPAGTSINLKTLGSDGKMISQVDVHRTRRSASIDVTSAAVSVRCTIFRNIATTEDCEMIAHPMLEKGGSRTVWEPPENAGGGKALTQRTN